MKNRFKAGLIISFIIVFTGVFIPLHIWATIFFPPRDARLFLATGETVNSTEEAIFLFERYKDAIIEKLSVSYPKLKISVVNETQRCKASSVVDIGNIDFLFEHISCKELGKRKEFNYGECLIIFPKEMLLFRTSIPMVLNGSVYEEKDGQIILAEYPPINKENNTKYTRGNTARGMSKSITAGACVQYATFIDFILDEDGNIYEEHLYNRALQEDMERSIVGLYRP